MIDSFRLACTYLGFFSYFNLKNHSWIGNCHIKFQILYDMSPPVEHQHPLFKFSIQEIAIKKTQEVIDPTLYIFSLSLDLINYRAAKHLIISTVPNNRNA